MMFSVYHFDAPCILLVTHMGTNYQESIHRAGFLDSTREC